MDVLATEGYTYAQSTWAQGETGKERQKMTHG